MIKRKESESHSKPSSGTNEREVDVLYQKMGDRWYAFSLVDDEIFFGSIAQEDLPSEKPLKSKKTKLKDV